MTQKERIGMYFCMLFFTRFFILFSVFSLRSVYILFVIQAVFVLFSPSHLFYVSCVSSLITCFEFWRAPKVRVKMRSICCFAARQRGFQFFFSFCNGQLSAECIVFVISALSRVVQNENECNFWSINMFSVYVSVIWPYSVSSHSRLIADMKK
jgi:hypothetical protein